MWHPPARRPCRLEHPARQRPLGADLQECQVCLEPGRISTSYSALEQGIRRKGGRRTAARSATPCCRWFEAGKARMVKGAAELEDGLRITPAARVTRPGTIRIEFRRSQGQKALFCRRTSCITRLQVYHPEWNSFACLDPGQLRARSRRAAIEHCAGSGRAADGPAIFGAPVPLATSTPRERASRPRFRQQLLEGERDMIYEISGLSLRAGAGCRRCSNRFAKHHAQAVGKKHGIKQAGFWDDAGRRIQPGPDLPARLGLARRPRQEVGRPFQADPEWIAKAPPRRSKDGLGSCRTSRTSCSCRRRSRR